MSILGLDPRVTPNSQDPNAGRWERTPTFGERMRVAAKAAVGIFSDDSLKAAYGLLAGALPGGMGIPPTRGTADYLRAYSQMPFLRAVVGRIATAVASAEWELYVVKRGNQPAQRNLKAVRLQRAIGAERRKLLKQAHAEGDLQPVLNHPLLTVLNESNEFQTGLAVRKLTQIHLDLVGDAFWLKERDAQGTVTALWPIPPYWILATPTPAFKFFRVSFRAWRGIIPDTEFVWFSDADPWFPYGRGTGVAMALGDELEADEYAARHVKSFFYNSARPDLIVWPKAGNIGQPNVDRMEERWLEQTQGFFRAFKPYFLSREVGIKELDQNFRSMQLVQLRQFERDTILQTYGMPPEILGVLENSNRATIDAADYLMARHVTEPRLEFLRTVIQARFAPEFDERLIVEFVSPVQDDREFQLNAAKAAPWALSLDEWRKLAGQAPLEDEAAGKLHAIPNLVTLTDVEAEAESIANPPPPPTVTILPPAPGGVPPQLTPATPVTPAPETPPVPPPAKTAWQTVLFADVAAARDAYDTVLESELLKITSLDIDALPAPSAVAARMEPGLARALVRTWRAHAQRLSVSALAEALGPSGVHGDVVELLDVAALNAAQTSTLEPALRRAALKGADVGASALRRHGVAVRGPSDVATKPSNVLIDLAGVNRLATEWAKQHAAALVQAPAEVRATIARLVARANEEGITPQKLAKLIQNVVGLNNRQADAVMNFYGKLVSAERVLSDAVIDARTSRYAEAQLRSRGITIARTELIGALNGGQQAIWGEAVKQGAIRKDEFVQVWLVTEDDALDEEICEPMTDMTTGIGEPFDSPDGPIDGPPAHTNCRCAVGLQQADASEDA